MKKINDLYTLSTPLNLPVSRKVNLDHAAQESIDNYYFDWGLILPDFQSTGKRTNCDKELDTSNAESFQTD